MTMKILSRARSWMCSCPLARSFIWDQGIFISSQLNSCSGWWVTSASGSNSPSPPQQLRKAQGKVQSFAGSIYLGFLPLFVRPSRKSVPWRGWSVGFTDEAVDLKGSNLIFFPVFGIPANSSGIQQHYLIPVKLNQRKEGTRTLLST